MKKIRHISMIVSLLVFLLLSACTVSFARAGNPGARVEEALEQTMRALYEFDFFLADSISSQLLKNYPDHYLSHFTRAQYLWWLIITQAPDGALEAEFGQTLARSLRAIDQHMGSGRKHSHTFFFINIYAMQARLFLKNKEYLRTILSLKNCINQIEISLGSEGVFPPYNLSSGMYNYMSEFSKKRYPFLALYTLLYPKGNMELGLQQLKTAAAGDHFIWKTEATYLLMKIYFELEKDPSAAYVHGKHLVEKFPDNLIFQWHYLQIAQTRATDTSPEILRGSLLESTRKARGISAIQKSYLLPLFAK